MTEESKKKLSRHLDKIVMGVIIGGAVLSVIGARRLAKKKRDQEQSLFEDQIPPAPKLKKRGILRKLLGF